MGFNTALLILSPARQCGAPQGCVFWNVSEVLNLGYSVRDLPKLTAPQMSHIAEGCESKSRAGVATFSHFYPHLCARIRTKPVADLFAPQFLVEPEEPKLTDRDRWWLHTDAQIAALPEQSHVVMPFRESAEHSFPSLHDMHYHNRALPKWKSARGHMLGALRRSHNIVCHHPMLWVSCRTVSQWLDELWNTNTISRTQLQYDRQAKARVQGWHGQVRSYAAVHARVLFVHQRLDWP